MPRRPMISEARITTPGPVLVEEQQAGILGRERDREAVDLADLDHPAADRGAQDRDRVRRSAQVDRDAVGVRLGPHVLGLEL